MGDFGDFGDLRGRSRWSRVCGMEERKGKCVKGEDEEGG